VDVLDIGEETLLLKKASDVLLVSCMEDDIVQIQKRIKSKNLLSMHAIHGVQEDITSALLGFARPIALGFLSVPRSERVYIWSTQVCPPFLRVEIYIEVAYKGFKNFN